MHACEAPSRRRAAPRPPSSPLSRCPAATQRDGRLRPAQTQSQLRLPHTQCPPAGGVSGCRARVHALAQTRALSVAPPFRAKVRPLAHPRPTSPNKGRPLAHPRPVTCLVTLVSPTSRRAALAPHSRRTRAALGQHSRRTRAALGRTRAALGPHSGSTAGRRSPRACLAAHAAASAAASPSTTRDAYSPVTAGPRDSGPRESLSSPPTARPRRVSRLAHAAPRQAGAASRVAVATLATLATLPAAPAISLPLPLRAASIRARRRLRCGPVPAVSEWPSDTHGHLP